MSKYHVFYTHILTTDMVVISVYEEADDFMDYSNFTHVYKPESQLVGKVNSVRLPEDIAELPVGKERTERVYARQEELDNKCYQLIRSLTPELFNLPGHVRVRKTMGEFELFFDSVEEAKAWAKEVRASREN